MADTPVVEILPEFGQRQVLDGFNADGRPRMRAPRTQATVRHLATHTSGLVYELWNKDMQRYMQATGLTSIDSGSRSSLAYPLLFETGTQWDYGIGIDWLGQVVEKVDGRTIDRFCREEIIEPLEMKDTRFEADADIAPRLACVRIRGEDTLRNSKSHRLRSPISTAWATLCIRLRRTTCDFCVCT